jgi:hypothetical protein
MKYLFVSRIFQSFSLATLCGVVLCSAMYGLHAQQTSSTPVVPNWALPGSLTHVQVPPPEGFYRATRTENIPIGIFQGPIGCWGRRRAW